MHQGYAVVEGVQVQVGSNAYITKIWHSPLAQVVVQAV